MVFQDVTRDELFKLPMTPAMEGRVEEVLQAGLESASPGRLSPVEFKSIRYAWIETGARAILMLVVETGRVGDEGTAASLFCRSRGMFIITGRGKLTLPSSSVDRIVQKHNEIRERSGNKLRKLSKTKVLRHPLIYGWNS